jgi:hypothetical protein
MRDSSEARITVRMEILVTIAQPNIIPRPRITPRYCSTLGVARHPAPIAVPANVNIDPRSEPGFTFPKVLYPHELGELGERNDFGDPGEFGPLKLFISSAVSLSYGWSSYMSIFRSPIFTKLILIIRYDKIQNKHSKRD